MEQGRKVAIDIGKANIFAVVIMIVSAVVLMVPFFFIWGGAKAGVFVGSWAGPAGSLLGGIIGAIGGAMAANYIIETHKEQ